MKTIVLCGGKGTRLDRHGALVPKALFRIGEEPLILHLMRIYRTFGLSDFTLSLGYLAEEFGKYFDVPVAGSQSSVKTAEIAVDAGPNVTLTLLDTGLETNTGGRVKKLESYITDDTFCVTYGDGLADLNLTALIDFHRRHGKIATLTAVNPVSNFGLLDLGSDGSVNSFREKPKLKEWINGGFFVFERRIFDYLDDSCVLEKEPFERLAAEGELMAYRHDGFWKCMDTFKDNVEMNEMWDAGAPWKVW
ncbi:MAG: sugar phosphate nucleotidyltransferase [Pyrinomonadaceae bacterium]